MNLTSEERKRGLKILESMKQFARLRLPAPIPKGDDLKIVGALLREREQTKHKLNAEQYKNFFRID